MMEKAKKTTWGKRLPALLLALMMCLSLLPTTALAVEWESFDIENGVLIKYTGLWNETEAVIPDGVTAIGTRAFSERTGLISVTIPDGVTSIGDEAFIRCGRLKNAAIPDSVTSIGDRAFYRCQDLTGLDIPSGVTKIGDEAFFQCTNAFTHVTIPGSVTSIGYQAFYQCRSMTSLDISSGVTSIGGSAFMDCDSLTSVTIPDSVTSIGRLAFQQCRSLTSVTIPGSVTSIGARAFEVCDSLASVEISGGITKIEFNTFYLCKNLKSVTIPASVTEIGEYAFYGCPLTDIYYGGSQSQWNAMKKASNSISCSPTIHYADGSTSVGPGSTTTDPGTITDPCANGHSYDGGVVTKQPTANATGVKTYTCTVCGKTKTESIPKLGCTTHSYNSGVVTKQPTVEAEGIKTYTCTVCGETKTESIPKLEAPKVTFNDVPSWFTKEVGWAAAEGITEGYGDGRFGTNNPCTNAQILTFLWRAKDKPDAKGKSPFTVQSYYQGAVDWAYGEGIIDTSFNSEGFCTRATAMQYIWQAFGKQSAAASSFVDVPANAPYAAAVNWGVAKGLTKGYGNNDFRPDNICSRGEIAAFLYRAYN